MEFPIRTARTLLNGPHLLCTKPKNVTISAYVTNNVDECLCVGKNAIELTVLPRSEGEIKPQKILDSPRDDIEIGDTISYRIIITNIGETKIVFLPLLDDYPEEFLETVKLRSILG